MTPFLGRLPALSTRSTKTMRAYGPGHPQPGGHRHHHGGRATAPMPESESEGYSSSHLSSSDAEHDNDSRSETSSVPTRTGARPWTLPHVDGHARRRAAASEDSTPPRVVVHPHGPPPSLDDPADVWTIRPRAGSGRTSLGRRRRYDSYVSTLDLDELRELDEELLRRAILGEDEIVEEEEEEDEDEDEAAYARHTRRRREDDHGVASAQRGSTGSNRRRERLCDEGSEPDNHRRCSPSRRSHQHRRHAQEKDNGVNIADDDEADDGVEEVKNPRERQRQRELQQQQRRAAAGRMPGVDTRQQGKNVHHQSPLRTHRDSIGRGAPPPNPTFHDPKMGPLPATAPHDEDDDGSEEESGRGGPSRRGIRSNVQRLSFKRTNGKRPASSQAPHEGEYDDGRRDSGMSFAMDWLYGRSSHEAGDRTSSGTSGTGSGPGKRTLLYWLDQRLPRMSDEQRIARASLYLSDAIDTRPVRMRGGGKGNLYAYRLLKRTGWLWMMQTLAVFHLMLALWEPPRALPNAAHYHNSISRHELTGAASTAQSLLGLELVLVLFFLLDICMEIYALGFNQFFGINAPPRVLENKGKSAALQAKLWGQGRFLLVVLFFADVCAALDQPNGSPRFSRPLRPLYLVCLSETLKRWSILLVHLMAQLRDVALGTGIFLGLFSLLGLILFSETGYYAASIPYLNFNDFLNSFLALYVLMTTQNFGALLNPAYTANPQGSSPLYFFFFMAFVLIVVLFLAHLALPRVFWVYQKFQRKQAYESRLLERLALLMTFRCLDPTKQGWIDLSSFRSMLRYARPDFFDLHTGYEKDAYCGATEHMFSELAHAHPGRIYPHEFLGVCEVILTEYHPCVPTLEEPGMAASEWHQRERARFRAILSSRYAEAGSMALLLLTCFFLTFYGSPAISKASLQGFSYFVVVVFTTEMCLKVWAFGPKPFFSSPSNVVDLLIIAASFISMMVYAMAPPHSPTHESGQMANLCLLFLTLRVLRLFPKCTIFHKFSSAFRVLPFFLSSFSLCVLISYSWAVFGMILFSQYGEAIANATATSHQELAAWTSVDNFNSFWSASVTLFQVATTYDWYRIMYLWMDIVGSPWVAIYFLAFHLVANVVIYQLTAALFIDAFLSFNDKRWVEQDEDGLAAGKGGEFEDEEDEVEEEEEEEYDETDAVKRWSQKSGAVHSPSRSPSRRVVDNASPTPSEDIEGQTRRRSGREGHFQAAVI